jgi:hypothetical protein
MAEPRLLALSFVNPLLLGGLGLSVVPILIHLLSRQRFRRVAWGATRFLLEAEKVSRRRRRFEQWLLVALRCAALALLALLVARPFVQPGLIATLLGGPERARRILVLDDSASLAYRVGGEPEFRRLTRAAERLLSWLHAEAPTDPVTVFLSSAPDQPLLEDRPLSDTLLEELRSRLRRLAPRPLPARPRAVFERVADRLEQTGQVVRSEVYVFSDFQRSDWLAPDSPSGGAAGPEQSVFAPLRRAAGPVRLRVFPIASGVTLRDNVAVHELRLERRQTVAGQPARLTARIVNHTRTRLERIGLQLEVEGSPVPLEPLEPLEAGQERKVSVEAAFPEEGFHEVSLAVSPQDNFALDDCWRLAVQVKDSLPVLLVDGQPASDPARDEVHLLRTALAPPGAFSSGIRIEVIDSGELEATPLEAFDCVMLCNVGPLPPGATAALERYARQGGGVVFFLGSEAGEPEEFNRAFWADGAGLLPLPLRALQRWGPEGGVGLLRVGEHPVTAIFPGGEAELSEQVRFRAYYASDESATLAGVAPAVRPGAVVLARFADAAGTPALIERGFGRGRVLLFTSSADLDWNDWPRALDGSYVVTMLELVQYAARGEDLPGSLLCGEPLVIAVSPESYEPRALLRPAGDDPSPPLEALPDPAGGSIGQPLLLIGPRAERLGTYRAELIRRSGSRELRPLCVNLDPGESDLSVAGPAEIEAALVEVPHERVIPAESFLLGREQTRHEVWTFLLALLVALLMAEQMLAWWFGTPRAVRTPPARGVIARRRASAAARPMLR